MQFDAIVEETLVAAVDLIEAASHETELLRVMRPQDIVELMAEKQGAAEHYSRLLKKLDRRREVFADLPDRRKDEIRVASDWVKHAVGENARVLRASAEASEKLLIAIKTAAEEEYGGAVGAYDRDGRFLDRPTADSAVKVSLGVDERT